jgi:hypothetical protein
VEQPVRFVAGNATALEQGKTFFKVINVIILKMLSTKRLATKLAYSTKNTVSLFMNVYAHM